jgi:hypothetical protein
VLHNRIVSYPGRYFGGNIRADLPHDRTGVA